VRAGELVVESRLTDPGLADDRDDLPVTRQGALERLTKLIQLVVTADEAREAARGGGLEARARRARP
jgi:hypothetical protein